MAKITRETRITLELTPRECELLWEVLERVHPYPAPNTISSIEDSRYQTISDIRNALVNEVHGRNDEEEEILMGEVCFKP